MTKRRANRRVVLTDADRLAHVHPRRLRNGPTHVCDNCDAEFVPIGETARPGIECPVCGDGRLVELPEFDPDNTSRAET